MSDLKSEPQRPCGCVGRNPGFFRLTHEDVDSKFASLIPGMWRLVDESQKLVIQFTSRNWSGAVAFINELSLLADSAEISHHPGKELIDHRSISIG